MSNTREKTIESWMNGAIDLAVKTLTVLSASVTTHQVLTISGFNASPKMRRSIARYLVGLRVNAITAGLAVRAELTSKKAGRVEAVENVSQIVGSAKGSLTTDQITKHRNPWIAEGIWHLCLVAAQQRADLHPPGNVLAVNLPHPKSNDHGVDVAVIYATGQSFGLSIIESKAYVSDVAGAIQSSLKYFKEIDRGVHAVVLRQLITVMRGQIPGIDQSKVSQTLWQKRRCYMPNPHFDAAHAPKWTSRRPSFGKLQPGPSNIYFLPHEITGFLSFFEEIADEMRAAAASL